MELWPDRFPKMSTVLPDGATVGKARIVHVTPSKEDAAFASIRAMMHKRGSVQAGETLCQLFSGNCLWMSDTSDERRDHWAPHHYAKGQVLIGGLGLGMVTLGCALKPEVEKVTVIEMDPDVIALVLPHLRAALESQGVSPDKIEVIQADVFKWKPPKGVKYDCIWMDVWEEICTDNLDSYAKLNRKFAKNRAPGGYRGAWAEDELRHLKRQEAAEDRFRNLWRGRG
jgi:hypothetical protein